MVNIRQHDAAGPVLDANAEIQFAQAWGTYRKLVDNDCVFHSEVYGILHRILLEDFRATLPLSRSRLRRRARHRGRAPGHLGRPLSRRRSLAPSARPGVLAVEALPCQTELDQRDFVAAMAERPEPADMVWIGLSLHHLQTADKLVIVQEVRGIVGDRGEFMLYEPTCRDGESRDEYLARFAAICRPLWTALTPEEWDCINDHVTQCDFPETSSTWLDLGLAAGFKRAEQPFMAPTDLYGLFRYRP